MSNVYFISGNRRDIENERFKLHISGTHKVYNVPLKLYNILGIKIL